MKILYDHQIFSYQEYGGISRYFSELIRRGQNSGNTSVTLSLKFSNNHYLEKISHSGHRSLLPGFPFKRKPGLLNIINTFPSRSHIRKQDFDVFHPTYYNPYFLKYLKIKPFVVTVYDMIDERYPHIHPDQQLISTWKKTLIHQAERIIAISHSTKKDILSRYKIKEDKISVIHLASSLAADDSITPVHPFMPNERYLLFVGDRLFYKNFAGLVKAIAPLLKGDSDLYLICGGGKNWSTQEMHLMEEAGITKRVRQIPIKDNQLINLYSGALAFIFPSLYEGFGIPVLEAFSCGCPVLASNRGSLPEVAGNAAVYFDPEDMASIREAIKKVLDSKELRENLIRRGAERVKKFSWDRVFQETCDVYRNCL